VIVRAKNEAPAIGRLLDLLAQQTVKAELIVVDSGSTDGTVEIVKRHDDVRLIEIPAASFTFGAALNTGCDAASGDVLVALSAHAFPRDERWLERVVATFADERVAAACGDDFDFDGSPLREVRVQDEEIARRNLHWGYSNSAGAFRAELWRQHPFHPDMPGTEDKEFAWHWQQRGYVVVIDPALRVDHDHWKDPLPDIYERARREWVGYSMFLPLEPYGIRELVREWWTQKAPWRSYARARLSHRRAARLLGKYRGRRQGGRVFSGSADGTP
jgi:rhamnosyltransferase